MIDVNGVYFEPRQKVTELTNSAIYEGKDGYRYVVKRDTRNQAIKKLEQERAKTGLSPRKYGKSIGVPMTTYERWFKQGKVPSNNTGIRVVMDVLDVSRSVAIELIKEV